MARIQGNSDEELMDLRRRCIPLMFDCSLRSKPKDCPFADVRKRDVVDQVDWLKVQTAETLADMFARHERCFKKNRRKKA